MSEPENDIQKLENHINRLMDIERRKVNEIDNRRKRAIKDMVVTEGARVARTETRVTGIVMEMYLRTTVRIGNHIVHHSPGIIGTLSAIWSVLNTVYKALQWVVQTFHVKEIIQLIQLARDLSPKFRRWTNELLKGVKNIAESIGIGAATMYNVLHSIQGVLSSTASMLGKDWQWIEGRFADKSLSIAEKMKNWGQEIANNPADFIDDVFIDEQMQSKIELEGTWQDIWNGIENGVEWGKEALNNAKDLTTSLQELENSLPEKVKQAIPESIWDTVGEIDRTMENVIEPRFNQIEEAVNVVSSAIESQSDKLSNLAERMALPGDYISEINQLDAQLRALQESKVDDVSGNQFNSEITNQNNETADIFNDMQVIDQAGIPPGKAPAFLGLEPQGNPRPPGVETEQYETWFVGDY